MANKNWKYIVVYVDIDDLYDQTPAKRKEIELNPVDGPLMGTSVTRAVNKAIREIMEQEDLESKKDIVILDCVREDSPLFG